MEDTHNSENGKMGGLLPDRWMIIIHNNKDGGLYLGVMSVWLNVRNIYVECYLHVGEYRLH